MKTKIKIIILILAAVIFTSCSDWFEVTSSNEIREKDHFSSDIGFQQSLTGCYIAMSQNALFGKNLTWYVPVLMANETADFASAGSNIEVYSESSFQKHIYTNTGSKPIVEAIWASSYSVIANVNATLVNIDTKQQDLNPINYHIVKGELLAIRALMHFQLWRLFGYGDWSNRKGELDAKRTIPYVTTVTKEITEQATGAEVFQHLVNDLSEAEGLLKDFDPVCGVYAQNYYDEVNESGYYNNRNSRLNYYAVKGLLAQVYLWEGSPNSINAALRISQEIINDIEGGKAIYFDGLNTFILHFLDAQSLTGTNSSMAEEALFSLRAQDLTSSISDYFKPSYKDTDFKTYYLPTSVAANLYDDADTEEDETATDIRFSRLLNFNANAGNKIGYALIKLYQATLDYYNVNKVSVIRLPEIYYIAAECYARSTNPNMQKAVEMLSTVRNKRGLYTPISANISINEFMKQLQKEYCKEFLGEGEVFYLYKRLGVKNIPSHDDMNDSDYLLPFPDFEIQAGRLQ